jgi:hypothetical protein
MGNAAGALMANDDPQETAETSANLARGRPASPHEPDPLDAPALLAAILNDVLAVVARRAPLDPHRLLADDAGDQCKQRVAIVIHRSRPAQTLRRFSPLNRSLSEIMVD